MTQMVTIEGSTTPSAELPRGERRTVVYSDRIARLVKRGFVVIAKGPWDVPDDLGQPKIAEGTGVPNVGHELPADGQTHDISLPGVDPPTPLAQVVPDVPQHPNETAQPGPAAEAAEAALHEPLATFPKVPPATESGTGG